MSDTYPRKDIIYLYNKLANINSTKEQLIFLEEERVQNNRVFNCLAKKRMSYLKYLFTRNKIIVTTNCPELHRISVFILKCLKRNQHHYRSINRVFSFLYGWECINYFAYRNYHKYLIRLNTEYSGLIGNEIEICNEKLKLGFHVSDADRYSEYVKKVGIAKSHRFSSYIKKEKECFAVIPDKEFLLFNSCEMASGSYKALFLTAKDLNSELGQIKSENGRNIFLLELRKDIRKILIGLRDLSKSSLRAIRISRYDLRSSAPEALFFLKFLIDENKRDNGKVKLTIDLVNERVKRKISNLEKLNRIIKHELRYISSKQQSFEIIEITERLRQAVKPLQDILRWDTRTDNIAGGVGGTGGGSNKDEGKGALRITLSSEKKLWKGTKSEFAVFVNEEYLSRKREFKSLREATKNLYEKFRFKYDWTLEDCYGLVRKN